MSSRGLTPVILGTALLLVGAAGAIRVDGARRVQASSTTAAQATPLPPRPVVPNLMGTLTSVSGNTLKMSLLSTRTTATVHLTSNTTYVVNGKTTKTRPTWKKGEQIGVVGTKAKNGSYTAKSIMVGAPSGGPGGPPPGGMAPVTGAVVSASNSSLVVKTSKGRSTFKLTSTTRYSVNGKPQNARPTFKHGTTVHVMAARSGTALIAQMVFIGSMPAPSPGGAPPSSSSTSA